MTEDTHKIKPTLDKSEINMKFKRSNKKKKKKQTANVWTYDT